MTSDAMIRHATLTNMRFTSRNWRIASLVRCISTSQSSQPPAFVFDIVGVPNTSRVVVADHPLGRMEFCSEARQSSSQRETHSESFTVTTPSTGPLARISERDELYSRCIAHRKIPYIFVREGSDGVTPWRSEGMTARFSADQRRWC